jgi:hypothetical protein
MEIEAQASVCQVSFKNSSNELICTEGNASDGKQAKEIQSYERSFVSQGIADGLHHAIVDSNFERLPCAFLEYLIRQTFVWQTDKNRSRLQAMRELKASGMAPNLVVSEEKRLSALVQDTPPTNPSPSNKFHKAGLRVRTKGLDDATDSLDDYSSTDDESRSGSKSLDGSRSGSKSQTLSTTGTASVGGFSAMGSGTIGTTSLAMFALPSKMKKAKERAQYGPLFDDKSFTLSMSANDFQAEMSRHLEKSKKKLEEDFHGFLTRKGIDTGAAEKLSPRQRLLSQIVKIRKSSKDATDNPVALNVFMKAAQNLQKEQDDTNQAADKIMEVEDLEHPPDNSKMLTMTPKAQTPPESLAPGFGDTLLPSAIDTSAAPPVPPGAVQTSNSTGLQPAIRRPNPRSASPAPGLPPPPPPPS